VRTPFDRYATDPVFRSLVDLFYNHLVHGNFTPTEAREALHLAMCKIQDRFPRQNIFEKQLGNDWMDWIHGRKP
jgi:hypothetical protein